MFTGIVEEIGIIREINKTWTGISLKINASDIYRDVKLGDSVAINGVCLTVTGKKDNILKYYITIKCNSCRYNRNNHKNSY